MLIASLMWVFPVMRAKAGLASDDVRAGVILRGQTLQVNDESVIILTGEQQTPCSSAKYRQCAGVVACTTHSNLELEAVDNVDYMTASRIGVADSELGFLRTYHHVYTYSPVVLGTMTEASAIECNSTANISSFSFASAAGLIYLYKTGGSGDCTLHGSSSNASLLDLGHRLTDCQKTILTTCARCTPDYWAFVASIVAALSLILSVARLAVDCVKQRLNNKRRHVLMADASLIT
jgi:hypothetical protein